MDLEVFYLSETDFPLCFFSDVHGDVDMLRQLFTETEGRCGAFFCVGDLVDYRASIDTNTDAVQLCQRYGVRGVRGNHDDGVLGPTGALSAEGKEFFWSLPDALVLETPLGRFGLFHSTPTSNVAHTDASTISAFVPVFKKLELSHVFLGHTHSAYTFEKDGLSFHNLGHLGRGIVGDENCSYAVLSQSGILERFTFAGN